MIISTMLLCLGILIISISITIIIIIINRHQVLKNFDHDDVLEHHLSSFASVQTDIIPVPLSDCK